MRRSLLLVGMLILVGGSGSSPPTSQAREPVPVAEVQVPIEHATVPITAEGMGAARLGMTLGALKQAMPDAEFRIQSPFMVDIDAIVVTADGDVQFYVLYLSSDAMTDASTIELLMTDNPAYRTAEGVGPGTPVQQAEAAYGKATLNYHTAYESREYVEFADLSGFTMTFRTDQWSGREHAGIYPESIDGEYFTTDQYREGATIGAVQLRGDTP